MGIGPPTSTVTRELNKTEREEADDARGGGHLDVDKARHDEQLHPLHEHVIPLVET